MSDLRTPLPSFRPIVLCVLATSIASLALAGELKPVERTTTSFWIDDIRVEQPPGGDASKNWTQASGAPWMSVPSNWNPITALATGDDLLFGTLKPGNYSAHQDTGLTFGNLTVSRSLSTEQLALSGGINASALRVTKGVVNSTSTNVNLSTPGATNNLASIVVGDGASNSAMLTFTGTVGTYYDARIGVNGSTGSLSLMGVNTSFVPFQRNTSDSVFGGTADAANSTILVDAATLEAWVITTGVRGSTRFTNGAQISSVPTPSGVGQVQIGSPDASNVTFEISANADLRVTGEDGTVLIGAGVGATTDTKILSGGSIVTDLVITGAQSTTGTAASNNAVTISGTGSTLTVTEAFQTNGAYRFTDLRRGTTTVNIVSGARLLTSRYDSNGADRASDAGAASSTVLLVDGFGSLLQARTDVAGIFVSSLGDRTTDTITVSNFGNLDSRQMALGVGVGSTSTLNVKSSARVTSDLLEMARPFKAGPQTTANVDVSDSGKILTGNLVTSSSVSAVTNITVRGGGSTIDSTGVAILGGVSGDPLGGGSTTLNITGGASASFIAMQAGGASAAGKSGSYTGTQITLSGLGSQLTLRGSGSDTPQSTDLAANLSLAGNVSTTASLTVSNGANLNLLDNDANPNLDGAISMSNANNTVSSLLVDGPDASVDAGKLIMMSEAPTANAFTNANSTITVRNGAFLGVYENETDAASGNLQMSIRPSTSSVATLNIGGGTRVEDSDSAVAIDGTLFVGGSGDATPVAGGRSTVNLNNGSLSAAAVAVYSNSKFNMSGGHVWTDNLMAIGGRFDMSSTTPLTMELGAVRASNGGVINIGKGGAVVYYNTAGGSGSDLDTIRQLIHNGSNGGAWNGLNSITSSLLSVANPLYAIGYADIGDAGIVNMLDLTFVPGTQGVALRYTLRGDVNLNGAVDFTDLLALAQNYGAPNGSDWADGDFNYNQRVDFDDLVLLAKNYGQTLLSSGLAVFDEQAASRFASDWALAQSLVPEPVSASVLLGGTALLMRRNRILQPR
jgi:hypothetical protein